MPRPLAAAAEAGPACGFDPAAASQLAPRVRRATALARATWQFAQEHQASLEYLYARTRLDRSIAPTPASREETVDDRPFVYPEGGPFYPAAFAAANGLSGPLEVDYRTVALGPRTSEVTSVAQRVVLSLQGRAGGGSYAAAWNRATARSDDSFTGGYVSSSRLRDAIATGRIDPFGPPDAAGAALLSSTSVSGRMRSARATTDQVDAQFTRDLVALPGGPLALAIGAEWRRERVADRPDATLAAGDVLGTPVEAGPGDAQRTVRAAFVEADAPLSRSLSLTASLRHDRYSDFGGTTNPKVALRWQPSRAMLARASWGRGFRAPSLLDLHAPPTASTVTGFVDPVRCPVTGSPLDCGFGPYQSRAGGNVDLAPERSTQATAGILVEPVDGVSIGVDAWRIDQDDVIGSLDAEEIFDRFDLYGIRNVVRGPPDPAFPGLPGPIRSLLRYQQNLGRAEVSGIDIAARARTPAGRYGRLHAGLDGTYVRKFTAHLDGQPPVSNAGRYGAFDAVPRWRHYLELGWRHGTTGATLAQLFQSGYVDQNPDGHGNARRVGSYGLWNLQVEGALGPSASWALGVRNLFDTDPPASNQSDTVQAGYDPAYADPRGRTIYLRVSLALR